MSSTCIEYESLLGMVSSIRVHSDSSLFKKKDSTSNTVSKVVEEQIAEKFKTNQFHLKSLERFVKDHTPTHWIANDHPNGGLNYAHSKPLDFGDGKSIKEHWNRFEKILTDSSRKIDGTNQSDSSERNYNEFFITKDTSSKDPENADSIEHVDTWYDIMLLFGLRREQLFGKDLSRRIYNIGLPVARIVPADNSELGRGFLLCPVITLHRKPQKAQFRRTISVSLILVPVKESEKDKVSVQKIYDVLWDVGDPVQFKFENKTHLQEFIGKIPDSFTMKKLINIVMEKILSLITTDHSRDKNFNIQINNSLQKVVTYLKENSEDNPHLIFDDKNKIDSSNEKDLRMIIHPYHYFGDKRGGIETFPAIFKFRDLMINDDFLFDSSYLLFYNPRESYLSGIHYKKYENFPNLSMKWYFFLDLYMLMGVSLFKVMLHSFYHEIENSKGLQHSTDVQRDLIQDLDEFYDLDLVFSSYRDSYDRIKIIAGIDKNYKIVKDKINDLTNYFGVIQQRRINYAIVLLTIFTVVSSFIAVDFSQITEHILADVILSASMTGAIIYVLAWFGREKSR